MVLFTKHHPTFMSSETINENKLASIASIKISNDVDLVRSYLRDIGRVPLLSHEQEITLGRQVQEYMEVERAELEIIELTGDKPSIDELSTKLNLTTSIIKKRLRAGQRAKERMVAANLRLVVSVAKKYTKRNMELLDLLAGGEDLPDEQIEMDCMRGDLHSLLHQLPDLQCRVLRMRYGMDGDEPMSLTGIGRVLGISRDRVRNLERDGLRGLRRLSDNVEAYFVS